MLPPDELVSEMARGAVPPHLRGKVDDEDLSQEVLCRVHSSGRDGRFDGREDAEVRRFLRMTLDSVVNDLVRRFDAQKRHAAIEGSLDQALDGSSARISAWLAADQTSPSQAAARQELLTHLAEGLATLPEDQRRAVELYHLQGLTMAEVAARMGRSGPSAAGLLRRGMHALREHLERP
jgi:RNA polymerase sigma-70 factor (ECF subfamily)